MFNTHKPMKQRRGRSRCKHAFKKAASYVRRSRERRIHIQTGRNPWQQTADMCTKVFVSLLLVTLIGTSLSRSVSTSYQLDDKLSMQAKAVVPGLDRVQRRSSEGLVQRSWAGPLSVDQKHLISQFLPHLYAAELAGKDNNAQDLDAHFPSWIDFGRRSLEDSGADA